MTARATLKWAMRSIGIGVGGSIGYGAYLYETDPGAHRMVEAYGALIPVVVHYRFVEAVHKLGLRKISMEDWEYLDELYANSTVRTLGRLQGMYCKYGQTAAGFTNTFGEKWIQEFRTLESDVPPRPAEVVHKTICEDTGKTLGETFSYFDPVAVGSASIGQVHKAVLKATGETVAVKVQYPEAQHLFQTDMHAIRAFCELLAPEHVIVLSGMDQSHAIAR